jgi:esterase/lipase superfamily enzyme
MTRLTNHPITRRSLITGGASMLLGTIAPESIQAEQLPSKPSGTTVGMAPFPVRQADLPVFFVTNRPPTGDRDLTNQFGIGHAASSGGCVKIAVTPDRLQRSSVQSRVVSLRSMNFREMTLAANRWLPKRTAIVFVPGYNYTFNDAVVAGGNIKHDIQTASSLFVVAWNSQGSAFGYSRDTSETPFTEKLVRNLLLDLVRSSDFTSVQIIGHSIGTRSIVDALGNIAKTQDAKLLAKIDRAILAAPDVDVEIMRDDYIPVAEQFGIKTAIYVSKKDLMMRASEFWNGGRRVGGAWSTIYVTPSADTIDISDVDETVLGHSAIFGSSRIANDIHYCLEKGLPPQSRFQLQPVYFQGGNFWRMIP